MNIKIKLKKVFPFILCAILLCQSVYGFSYTKDERIFTDPVANEYIGRAQAVSIIQNINFQDLQGEALFETVARLGALNVIKGYDANYRQADNATNVEVLGAVIRAIGREPEANRLATTLANRLPEESDLRAELKIGYLGLANQMGLINPQQYGQVFTDQASLDPATAFIYDGPVTRQQAARWVYEAFISANPEIFASVPAALVQTTFNFTDWNRVTAANLPAVETLVAAGALKSSETLLRPRDYLTRTELAELFKSLDTIMYRLMGIEKVNGTVGGIRSAGAVATGSSSEQLSVYVRTATGEVDIIRNSTRISASGPVLTREIPVFKDGTVLSLSTLEEGDEIEYLVRPASNEVFYIEVRAAAPAVYEFVRGKFRGLDFAAGNITIETEDGVDTTFTMTSGLNYSEIDNTGEERFYITVDNKPQEVKTLPLGSTLVLRTVNDVVDTIQYIGEPNIVDEFRGIVIENNPELGYLVVFDNHGRRIIKDYYPEDMRVKKREYYHNDDIIGYINEVFPNFVYNPLESDIEAIEPGDIVFIVNDPDEPNYIKSISASTNYIARYGKILQFTYSDDGYYEMLLEYENKQTAWFDVSPYLFITRAGRPVPADSIQPGDWARVLVNQAVIGPGHVIESAKEIVLEGEAHHISTILRGQLSGLNQIQNQLLVQNALELTKDGWRNYKQAANFNISGRDIEYYHNNRRISLDYAAKHFRRAEVEVYIALENNFAGEKVRKVTFRDGRDQLLQADTVINADGNGAFYTMAVSDEILTDLGTIVRRNGRLVNGVNIMFYDWAVVALNNGSTAAVVDILDEPGNDGVTLHRGGVNFVNERNDFQVRSFSQLYGVDWYFTPIQRLYDINYNTTFVTAEETFLNYDKFIDYVSQYQDPVAEVDAPVTAADMVYYVLTEGSAASWIIEAPWSTRAVRGTVYAVDVAAGQIFIKDATYQSNSGASIGQWLRPSTPTANTSASYTINVPLNSFIFKNNEVIGKNAVEIGDVITVMTPDVRPAANAPWLVSEAEIDGYIVFVDR